MTPGIQKICDNPDAWGALQGFLPLEARYALGSTCYNMGYKDPIISRRFNARPVAARDLPQVTVSKTENLWARCAFQKNPYEGPLLPALLPTNRRSYGIPILGPTKILATPITSTTSPEGNTIFQNHPIESDEEILSLAKVLRAKEAALQALPIFTEEELEAFRIDYRVNHLDDIEERIRRRIAERTAERSPIINRIAAIRRHLNEVRENTFFRFNLTNMSKTDLPPLKLRHRYLYLIGDNNLDLIYDVIERQIKLTNGQSFRRMPSTPLRCSYKKAKKIIRERFMFDTFELMHENWINIKRVNNSNTCQVQIRRNYAELDVLSVHSPLDIPSVLFLNERYIILSNGTIYDNETSFYYPIDQSVIRDYFPLKDLRFFVDRNSLVLHKSNQVNVIDLCSGELISLITLPPLAGKRCKIISIKVDIAKKQIHIAGQTDQYAKHFIYCFKRASPFEIASMKMRDFLCLKGNSCITHSQNIPSHLVKIITKVAHFLKTWTPPIYWGFNLIFYLLTRSIFTVFEPDNGVATLNQGRGIYFLRPGNGTLINKMNRGFKSLDTRLIKIIPNNPSSHASLVNFIAIAVTVSRIALLAIQGLCNITSTTIFVSLISKTNIIAISMLTILILLFIAQIFYTFIRGTLVPNLARALTRVIPHNA